ncbi:MAG: DUF1295 domain-containing protein [Hyphomicrobiales bacterium]|nr:DUF1295 domain-containing protein [Hyphomicrobiales bacterium]
MSLIPLFILCAIALSAVMALAWFVAERSRNSGWIDVIWSFAVGGAGIIAALAPLQGSTEISARQILVAVLAGLWSLRLGGYIVTRTVGGGDDPRYAHFRKEWGDRASWNLFWFLQIQAAAALLLVVTITAAARNPAPGLNWGDALGVLILIGAVTGAAISDRQLAQFRADPANKGGVCDIGLWGRSRHPNYFFEWLGWAAYVPIALSLSDGYAFGFLAFLGPIFMYWLLVYVSGIPPLEDHMLRSRGDAYRTYQARVNAFWPRLKTRQEKRENARGFR